jgi:hypothetical protein
MEQTREEWLAERSTGIGGSDWGAILNLKPYGCARRLMYEKRQFKPDYPEEKGGPKERGTVLEPIVADQAAEDLGVRLRRPGILPQGVVPDWWKGNPDRLVVPDGVWEGKTMHPIRFKKLKKEGIPMEHELQVQHYIKQTDRKYGLYTSLDPVAWEFYHGQIDRDESLIQQMLDAGGAFWNARLEVRFPVWVDSDGVTRDKLDPSDSRCRRCQFRMTCQGDALFEAVPELAPGELETLNDVELNGLLVERDDLDEVLSAAGDLKNANSKRIREILGGPRKILTPQGRAVYWINYIRHGTDMKALKAKHKDLVALFAKDTPVNQLRVY